MSANLLKSTLFCIVTASISCAHAQLMEGDSLKEITPQVLAQQIQAGDILILGENHGLADHQNAQLAVLQALRQAGHRIHLGMEFFDFTQQDKVDAYRQGLVQESEFLKSIGWGMPSYDFYRSQVLFPQEAAGERVRALNAPRSLTGQIAKNGLASLSDQQKSLLPPDLAKGNDLYFERFKEVMSGHIKDPVKLDNYFWSQSVWDETMAWNTCQFTSQHPQDVFVIIVGEFHSQYGGGLPDRLQQRKCGNIKTVSLVSTGGMSEGEKQTELAPSSKYGKRADWVWSLVGE